MKKMPNITGLTSLDKNTYLLKITSNVDFPARADIVDWCSDLGISINPNEIFIRNNILRVTAISGSVKFKPVAGLLAALRDTNSECIFAEQGDKVSYLNDCVKCHGLVQSMASGQVRILNTATGKVNNVSLTSLIKVENVPVSYEKDTNEEILKKIFSF